MKFDKLSMKWRVYLYFLLFTGILIVILWFFQIGYLETFYKAIKTREAENAMEQVTLLLNENQDNLQDEIDTVASESNLSIMITDLEGTEIYSTTYLSGSNLSAIPVSVFEEYVSQAREDGGSTKIDFRTDLEENQRMDKMTEDYSDEELDEMELESDGNDQRNVVDRLTESSDMAPPDGTLGDTETIGEDSMSGRGGFRQNFGQPVSESVIYVSIVDTEDEELVVLLNSLLTPVDATVNTLRIQLVWITLILIGLSLGIALIVSKNISKSIIKVNDSAKELAKGNFEVSFDSRDYREITELSDTLNYAAQELGKTENLRQELIANVSHDLRTPLTMIIAYSEVMRDIPGENTPENVQVVIDESKRLTNLVNDMLDLSKLQSKVMVKNASIYNLTESIKTVFDRYNKLKEQEGYTIDFDYKEDAYVNADEFKIFQVIYNLVNNAINYAGDDKVVLVRQTVADGRVKIEVIDHGEGIASDALPYVWERYYKVDKTHKRAVTGTGLGLSIVKNILELHEAEYGVLSEEGKGSTFWFSLKIESNV